MKNAFLFLFCVSLISACEKDDGPSYPAPYQYFSPHTIADYLDGDLTLETIKKQEPDWFSTTCNDEGLRLVFRNTVLYQDPNLEEPVNTEQYLECALKNGDTKSNDMLLPYNYPSTKHAFAFNCRSITVTSNKRFDANHPAGAPLNDLLILCVTTYGPHILSGYDPEVEEFRNVCKMLSEVTPEELSIVSADGWSWPMLYFSKYPDEVQKHKITVRIEADYGAPVRTATVECIPTKESSIIHFDVEP
ncbi:hypothetical protein [Alistipes sp.]|uniref:hypothetical protein n=1 Tax=Alistipes sp. TaxID=1872444 RepID=UPI003AB2410F